MSDMPVKIFISYAREDEQFKDELEKRLVPYVRNNLIDSWNDRAILPGMEWDQEIKAQMNAADVIIFLVSSDFLASDYINDVELVKAMQRSDKGNVKIVPVVVRPSDLSQLKITKFQALPQDGIPITKWEDTDDAWLNVINGLKKIFTSAGNGNASYEKAAIPAEKEDLQQEVETEEANQGTKESFDSSRGNILSREVKELVGDHKAEEAIELLQEHKSLTDQIDETIYNDSEGLSSRLRKIKRIERQGRKSQEYIDQECRDIDFSILELADLLISNDD